MAQVGELLRQCPQFAGSAVARSIIDIDDLDRRKGRHRARDLADQRRDIAGYVTHGHDDRDTWHGAGRWWAGIGHRSVRLGSPARYGAISARATLLIRLGDGPASACTAPSVPTTKPRRRRANQSRT